MSFAIWVLSTYMVLSLHDEHLVSPDLPEIFSCFTCTGKVAGGLWFDTCQIATRTMRGVLVFLLEVMVLYLN